MVLQDPNDATDDILRQNRSRQKEYLFDCVLGPQTSQVSEIVLHKKKNDDARASLQIEVYEATTRCLIDSVLSGYNATVFAYGPTGQPVWSLVCVCGIVTILWCCQNIANSLALWPVCLHGGPRSYTCTQFIFTA